MAIATPANMPDNMARPRRRRAGDRAAVLQHRRRRAAGPAPLEHRQRHEHARCRVRHRHRDRDRMVPAGQGQRRRRPGDQQDACVQAQDYAEASDRLVSRIAQQAAPRVATLMGKPPTFEARAPGQVAAGVNNPPTDEAPPVQTAAAAPARPPPARRRCGRRRRRHAAPDQGDGRIDRGRAVGRQPPAALRHAPRAGLEQDRGDRRGRRRHLRRGRQGQADADRRAAPASSTSPGS